MIRQKLYAIPFLLFLLGIVALPLGSVILGSFQAQDGLFAHYSAILSSKFYLNSFYTSLWLSVVTALMGVFVALPLGIRLRQGSRLLRDWALVFGNLGANFSGVPLVLSFIMLFGANGVLTGALIGSGLVDRVNLYSIGGLLLTYSFFQVALASVLLLPVVLSIPAEFIEAAVLMGTPTGRFWRRIGFPLIFRQIVSVTLLLFANAMGTYATAYALIGTSARVVTVRIGELVAGDVFSEPGLANALSVCLLAVLLISIALGQFLLKGRQCSG